ncbi:hypothetical protein HK101_006203, partial [Irineochytrium annulatum]
MRVDVRACCYFRSSLHLPPFLVVETRPSRHGINTHKHRPTTITPPPSISAASTAPSSSTTTTAPAPLLAVTRPRNASVKRIQRIPTDDHGNPVLPIQIGVIVIHSLGHVVSDRPAFHNDRYIYTPGFRSSRSFMSIVDPTKNVNYECTIVDGGDGPRFVVTPEDAPERASTGASATGAWNTIIKAAYTLRNKEHTSSVSGPDFFGISQKAVMKLIQDLPGARECRNYVWKEFEYITGRGSKRLLQPGEEVPVSSKKRRAMERKNAAAAGGAGGTTALGSSTVNAGGATSINGGARGNGG